MIEDFYNRDFTDPTVDSKTEMSQDERRFMQIAEQTVELRNGHYQISLPFKDRQTPVPSNKAQAWQRAIWLKKRLERDPKLYQDYKAFMEDILSKGYARKVSPDQKSPAKGTAWYIPHHGVYHPRKPGKIRVVFDCSAKFMGKSLNDMLYKGPDLTSSLVGVLLRFREEKVAVMADIESMFHQVRVPDPDSFFLRFFWWEDGNMARELQEYQMVIHLFGATLSPPCQNLALRKTAQDNRYSFPPDVINTVKRNFMLMIVSSPSLPRRKPLSMLAVYALYCHVVLSS